MNCLLIEPEELDASSGRAVLSGRRRRHADEILKARPGDSLRVGVVGGRMGEARIEVLDRETLQLAVELDTDPPPKLPLELVLALPRPPVFRRLLSTVASLGVESIWVVGTARTEKSFWQSHVTEAEEMRERLLLGIEQSKDTVLPEIHLQRYFEPLVETILPRRIAGRRAIVAHPGAPSAAGTAAHVDLRDETQSQPTTLFVGPEGGFIDYEIERLLEIGFSPLDLGPRVLRVEPVIPMLVGRLF